MTWLTGLLLAGWNLLPAVAKTILTGACSVISEVGGVADKVRL